MFTKMPIEDVLESLDGWNKTDDREAIFKKFTFSDFDSAFSAMTKIAFKSEEMNHHPEWFNVYNRLEVTLTTHDAGGITDYDLMLAKFIDEVCG